jgi:hypothetical protein
MKTLAKRKSPDVPASISAAELPDTVGVYRILLACGGRLEKLIAISLDRDVANRFAANFNGSLRKSRNRLLVLPPGDDTPVAPGREVLTL